MLAILFFGTLSFVLGVILSYTANKFRTEIDPIVEKINRLLPQSQCGQCNYPGCYSYAKAIIKKNEKINKCTPGGSELELKISKLLNFKTSLKTTVINEKKIFYTVWIDEKNCVGCSKCASFCPVDAIVGTPGFVHTVLQKFCNGCNICLSHCPTDCIKKKIFYE
ncbi:RnfABCDGE type electron transport complex subunit B [Buchnera aphidicola (Muscaphis stroyani)]|uniref:RnfABCDGE type electron transport complex subunit B n=1 Tax=Buchnera aphidicola (Muscaphis stroyani) TaxID=1241869 RepID=A0A4D6YJD4_9GAMM|nr:RnfABCDGE type electron transport complex subunit B [Buchnera aphidicola]QCI24635.1 RnfABCDGE type electron transport complex subunit B [Buchnera aphidicola (Muscaphis stroyani)]